MNNMKRIIYWIIRLVPAVILLQTLFYKFSAAPVSVYIFESLGLEPVGRIGIGVLELIAAAMILLPRTSILGAVLSLGLMMGALFSHLTVIGVNVHNDGGQLFALALIVALFSVFILIAERSKIYMFLEMITVFKKRLNRNR